jgi:outer membrane protein assembly factor BamB
LLWDVLVRSFSISVILVFSMSLPLSAADWPQWRGVGRDGHALDARLPINWPSAPPTPKWSTNIGLGYSGAAVVRGKLFIHVRDDDKGSERCLCLDAFTGKQIWEITYPSKFEAPDNTAGKGPNATPTVDQDRVYFFGLGGMLTCAEIATGKTVWQHDCNKEYWGVVKTIDGDDAWFPPCGASASPLVDGDNVIVPIGGKKAGAFTGFDRNSGQLVWKALEDRSSYASPIIASPGGVKQLIAFTGTRMVGLRHSDRELLWDYPFPTKYEQTIVSPVVWKDLVVIGGEAKPTVAMKLTGDGDKVKKEIAWKSEDLRMYLATPVVFAGHLIGFDHRMSRLICLKLDSGETVWTSQGLGTKHLSLVVAGNLLLALNLEGELLVIKASTEEYTRLAKWKVSERGTYAHIAVVGNQLYVKGPEKLVCYELK